MCLGSEDSEIRGRDITPRRPIICQRAPAGRSVPFQSGSRFLRCESLCAPTSPGAPLKLSRFEHEYEIGPHGKPSLPPQFSVNGLEFSLSHADEIALIAVSSLGAVGIDIEREVDSFDVHELAASVFNQRECRRLAGLSAVAARRGFLRMWVRKEAYAKACGLGLAAGLKVPVLDPTALDDIGRGQVRYAGGKTWLEWAVAVPLGYSAALYQRVDDMAHIAHMVPEIREWHLCVH